MADQAGREGSCLRREDLGKWSSDLHTKIEKHTYTYKQTDRQKEERIYIYTVYSTIQDYLYFRVRISYTVLHLSMRQGIKISTTVYEFHVTQGGRDRHAKSNISQNETQLPSCFLSHHSESVWARV